MYTLGGDECDISSPIHKSEAKFCEQSVNNELIETRVRNTPHKPPGSGLKKLAHLAEAINQWEDDIHPVNIQIFFKLKFNDIVIVSGGQK